MTAKKKTRPTQSYTTPPAPKRKAGRRGGKRARSKDGPIVDATPAGRTFTMEYDASAREDAEGES